MDAAKKFELVKGFITTQDIYPVYTYYNVSKMKRILCEHGHELYNKHPNLHDAAVCFIESYNMSTTYKKTYGKVV